MTVIVSKKLKGLMAENGITIYELSQKLKITEKKLSLKIDGRFDWQYWELICIIKFFGYSEVKEFFPELYYSILRVG